MNKTVQIISLTILFILFCIFEVWHNSGSKIIEIVTPTQVVVDLNNNGKSDDGEVVCVPKIKTFTANLRVNQNDLLEALGLKPEDGLMAGYLADEFAAQVLLGKSVKLNFTSEANSECRFAEIVLENENYSEELLNSGLAVYEGALFSPAKFREKLKDAEKLNLVILNRKSRKFHTFKCKFGLNSSDYLILPRAEVEQSFTPCKYCMKAIEKNNHQRFSNDITNELQVESYPEIFTVAGVKFILSDYTSHLTPDNNCTHYFCQELLNVINSANKSLDIAFYDWFDIPKVRSALSSAIDRGVKVRMVYDNKLDEKFVNNSDSILSLTANKKSDNISANKTLTSMLMHNKFLIADNKVVFTGSMNFTQTGLSGFNANNVVIIESDKLAKLYTEEFNQMYEGKFHTLKTKHNVINTFNVGNSRIEVYFSPQDKAIETAIIPLIDKSKDYIYIPVFVLTHKGMTEALHRAKNRGVDVKIILDATAPRAMHSTHQLLRDYGILLKTENYAGKVHNKSMIIDDKYVITGSMNFSNSGENKNDENCLIIENPEIAKFYRGYFEYIWAKIPDKWLSNSVRPEGKDSIGACADGIDNDYDGKIDLQDEGCR